MLRRGFFPLRSQLVSSGVLWRTTDFGRTWSFYSRTGSNIWTEELAISGRSFLLPTSGTDCDGQTNGIGSLRFSTDNGQTFNEFQTGANMFGTFLLDDRTGWGVGDDRAVYYTDNAGESWTLRNCGIEGNLDDIWFISDTLGWIAGDGLYKSNFNALRRRVDLDPPEAVIELCEGDSVLISATAGFTRYSWSDGTEAQARFLTDEGTYILNAFDEITCLESKDTVQIVFKNSGEPEVQAARREFCEGDSVEIELVGNFISQRWSTGETGRSIVVKQSGSYSVTTLDSNGCEKVSAILDIIVNPNPEPVIQSNRSTTICLDEEVTLSAPAGYESYSWSNGSREQSITVMEAGEYSVTVIDENGCIGTSDVVTVIVLNTRNKVDVEINSSDGVVVVPDHPVGELSCRTITIRNTSTNENLVVDDPALVGNVYCSIPISQLPIIIPPLESRQLSLCCAAIDTGIVRDTLIIPDTCSPTIIPIRSRGTAIFFSGTTRCEVPADVIVTSAGTSHHLSAPYPNPSSQAFELIVSPEVPVKATLVDALGAQRGRLDILGDGNQTVISVDTREVPPGPYMLMVELEGALVRSFPVTVIR